MGQHKMQVFGHPIASMFWLLVFAIAQSAGIPLMGFLYLTVLAHMILVCPLRMVVLAVLVAHVALGCWAYTWLHSLSAMSGHLLLLLSSTVAMGVMAGMVRRYDSLKAGLESGILVYACFGFLLASAGYLSIEYWLDQAMQSKAINAGVRQELLRDTAVQAMIEIYNRWVLALFWLRGVFALLLAYGLSALRKQKGGFVEILQHLRLHGGFAVLLAGLAILQFYYHPVGVMQSFFVLPLVVLSLFGMTAAHFATQQGALSGYGLGALYLFLLLPYGLGFWFASLIGLLDAFYNIRRNIQFDIRHPSQWVQTFCSLRMKRNALWV